jgi:hypothetical protein
MARFSSIGFAAFGLLLAEPVAKLPQLGGTKAMMSGQNKRSTASAAFAAKEVRWPIFRPASILPGDRVLRLVGLFVEANPSRPRASPPLNSLSCRRITGAVDVVTLNAAVAALAVGLRLATPTCGAA